jgi:RNA polymerase sigma-70 factor (ECF subfamily)
MIAILRFLPQKLYLYAKPIDMSHLEFTSRYGKLEAMLKLFAIRLTKDEEDAQDLLQETAYKAFKYRNLYEPQTNLRAWLMTIMRNTFINDYRKQKRRQSLNDQAENLSLLNTGARDARNQGESNVIVKEIHAMINQLEEWARIPFLLHYQGYKYDEIAQELDIPLGTVKSRIFFARKRLKEMIAESYTTERLEDLLN